MSYFYLPKIYPPINIDNLQIKYGIEKKSEKFLDTLIGIRQEIKKYNGHQVIIKLLSPYSLMRTIIKDNSLSNNYLLFTEIFNLTKINVESEITSIHFCKNDIDIINSLVNIRYNDNDKYYLTNNNDIINEQIIHDKKINNDILNENTFNHLKQTYKNHFDLITIMECNNYDSKENNIYILKVLLSIYIMKERGNFIFKIPNLYETQNIELLYFISNYFERTIIIKPNMNNYFNNDKYVCCKNLLATTNNDFIKYMCDTFYTFYSKTEEELKLHSFLKLNIPTTFISKIDECNSITAQSLLDNTCYLHNICKLNEKNPCNQKLSEINERNKHKCINWCITHGVEHIE